MVAGMDGETDGSNLLNWRIRSCVVVSMSSGEYWPSRMASAVWEEAEKLSCSEIGGTVKGVPWAWPKWRWLRSRRHVSSSMGSSTVRHSVQSRGDVLGSVGTRMRLTAVSPWVLLKSCSFRWVRSCFSDFRMLRRIDIFLRESVVALSCRAATRWMFSSCRMCMAFRSAL